MAELLGSSREDRPIARVKNRVGGKRSRPDEVVRLVGELPLDTARWVADATQHEPVEFRGIEADRA